MSSKYVTELESVGDQLAFDGYPISANICIRAAARMQRMEELIVKIHEETKDD